MKTTRSHPHSRLGVLLVSVLLMNGGSAIAQSPYRLTILGAGDDSTTPVQAYDINDAGQVVGSYGFNPSNGQDSRAAWWNGALGVDLNSLLRPQSVADGWVLTTAHGINDNGWIVGTAQNRLDCADGECAQYGFVLSLSNLPDQVLDITTAVPEPSTYALMLAGLGAMVLLSQRRRKASDSR